MKLPGNHGFAVAVTNREEGKTAVRNPRREKEKRNKRRSRKSTVLKLQMVVNLGPVSLFTIVSRHKNNFKCF